MTPVLDASTDEPLPPPSPDAIPFDPTPSGAPAERPRRRSGWHVAAIVGGIFLLLPGFGAAASGTALLVAQSVATDDGFFDATLDRLESDGAAITTIDLWDRSDDDDWPRALDWLDLDVRLWVESPTTAGSTDEVFVGIARTADVEDYLDGVAHSRVADFEHRSPEYVEMPGRPTADPPADLDIWDASAVGTGEQVLTWEARGGDWSAVVMNADASAGVTADVEVGVRSDALTPISIVIIVFGGIAVLAGTVLIVIGARGRRD